MKRIYRVMTCFLAVLVVSACGGLRTAGRNGILCSTLDGNTTWVYRCNRQAKKTVSLTFDDGPHPKLTPMILDILKEYGVHATFFLIGENAERYPALVNRIRDEEHEIGNHTYSHLQATKADRARIEEDLLRCESVIGGISDIRPKVFRPPCGECDPVLGSLCESLGYRVVLWSIDTRDWSHLPSDQIVDAVLKNVKDGDIILMHDYIGQNSPTPEALKKMIPALIARGYEFLPVSELLEKGEAAEPSQSP